MSLPLEIAGQKFFRLTAIEPRGFGMWLFRCDCGTEVVRRAAIVKFGNTKSCGCYAKDVLSERNGSRELTKHSLYWRWAGMLSRCENPNHVGFPKYGGRGISVCERWHNFEAFVEDMGIPDKGQTLERIDNNGNYTPGNCRWASRAEQARNTSRNRMIEHCGVVLPLRDWEDRLGFKRGAIQRRLELGWGEHDALTLPIQPGKKLERRK